MNGSLIPPEYALYVLLANAGVDLAMKIYQQIAANQALNAEQKAALLSAISANLQKTADAVETFQP